MATLTCNSGGRIDISLLASPLVLGLEIDPTGSRHRGPGKWSSGADICANTVATSRHFFLLTSIFPFIFSLARSLHLYLRLPCLPSKWIPEGGFVAHSFNLGIRKIETVEGVYTRYEGPILANQISRKLGVLNQNWRIATP